MNGMLFGGVLLVAGMPALAGDSAVGGDKTLLLHYQWIRGAISLVAVQEVAMKSKPSRSAQKNWVPGDNFQNAEAPRSPLSYEIVSDEGRKLSAAFLPDPSVKRVEIQEKGEDQLRSYSVKTDSADLFVQVSDPGAKKIRFFRHVAPTESGVSARKGAAKSLIAEFSLE